MKLTKLANLHIQQIRRIRTKFGDFSPLHEYRTQVLRVNYFSGMPRILRSSLFQPSASRTMRMQLFYTLSWRPNSFKSHDDWYRFRVHAWMNLNQDPAVFSECNQTYSFHQKAFGSVLFFASLCREANYT